MGLPTAYSDVYFYVEIAEINLPEHFYIITAYNPQGKNRSEAENVADNFSLQKQIEALPFPYFRILGGSADMQHKEPSFASAAHRQTINELAQLWGQLAIYEIDGDDLLLLNCSENSESILLEKGFRARVLKFNDVKEGKAH